MDELWKFIRENNLHFLFIMGLLMYLFMSNFKTPYFSRKYDNTLITKEAILNKNKDLKIMAEFELLEDFVNHMEICSYRKKHILSEIDTSKRMTLNEIYERLGKEVFEKMKKGE